VVQVSVRRRKTTVSITPSMRNPSDHCSEQLLYSAQTDIGMRRANNQDALSVVLASDEQDWARRGHVFVVADGMGAHAAGELASKLAADTVPLTYIKLQHLSPPDALRTALSEANALIHARGQSSVDFNGMGTTCSCLVLLPQGALIGHVGDSRVYRLREHKLEQLTFDHSLVWELRSAEFASEEIKLHVPKNVITRSLGPHDEVTIDLEGPFPAAKGDRYLLCSDGLSGPVADAEIGALLDVLPVEDAVQTLIHLANFRGGPDNITVIAVEVPDKRSVRNATGAGGDSAFAAKRRKARGMFLSFAIFVAVAGVLWAMGQRVPAVASGVVALAIGLVSVLGSLAGRSRQQVSPLGGPFGRGPYRAYDTQPNEQFVKDLGELTQQIGDACRQSEVPIDWDALQQSLEQAEADAAAGNYPAALSRYAANIRDLVQARRQAKR